MGLKIHQERREVPIDNIKVEILTKEDLGQTITFQQQETIEIMNRIRAAWVSFYTYKQELTSKSYLLQHRLRLFNMVIRFQHMDTFERTRENDTIDTAQNAPPHYPNKKKYKKKTQVSNEEKEKRRGRRAEKQEAKRDEEGTNESQSNSDCDQDSDNSS